MAAVPDARVKINLNCSTFYKKSPKMLASSKLKAFADVIKISNVAQMLEFIFKVENIVGKGENVGYQHFLLF